MNDNKEHILIISQWDILMEKKDDQDIGRFLIEKAAFKANRLGNEALKVKSISVEKIDDDWHIKFQCEYDPIWRS